MKMMRVVMHIHHHHHPRGLGGGGYAFYNLLENKKGCLIETAFFIKKSRQRPTLPRDAVPLALTGLTSLFGMGRGGSPPL